LEQGLFASGSAVTVPPMKTFTVLDAEGQLGRLISAANESEISVFKI